MTLVKEKRNRDKDKRHLPAFEILIPANLSVLLVSSIFFDSIYLNPLSNSFSFNFSSLAYSSVKKKSRIYFSLPTISSKPFFI